MTSFLADQWKLMTICLNELWASSHMTHRAETIPPTGSGHSRCGGFGDREDRGLF